MKFRTLDGLDVKGKRVLLRADLNVPMKDGKVTDAMRISRQAPTIRELAEKGARVIVLSHFGRPKGKAEPSMSLAPVAEPLSEAIGRPVAFAEDCVGPKAEAAVKALKDGEVLLLENTRFQPGEEQNAPEFVRQLASLGDIFVSDAFSAAHRAHASTAGITHLLPSYAGRAMEEELRHLEKTLADPLRPLMAVVGGAKVSSKIALLENMVDQVETLVIVGAMANTFLAAEGFPVGRSLHELNCLDVARRVIHMATESGCALLLPTDVVVAKELRANTPHRIVTTDQIAADEMALDVGPKTLVAFRHRLGTTKTLVWNGPFGAFETPPFDIGTVAAARLVAHQTTSGRLLSVAGGGDTVAALVHAGVEKDFSYVSTAGGAFLEWLEGKELPGVTALIKNKGE
ncbi:MAG TPA: phosphoglycerate kinase [Rhizomicrobium sp.]|jgi:phosphoglycerate kinase|nr:phosphoglycerate kinase [Rhizomicrobium sp.]